MTEKSRLFLNLDMSEIIIAANKSYSLAAITTRGPDKDQNEDCFGFKLLDDESLVVSIADGVGGHRGGGEASKIAISRIHDGLDEHPEFSPRWCCKDSKTPIAISVIWELEPQPPCLLSTFQSDSVTIVPVILLYKWWEEKAR